MRSVPESFYKTDKWKKARRAFIDYRVSIDGGLCQRCSKELGYIVHHKTHLDINNYHNPMIAYGFDNLEYVCKPCHEIEHGYCGQQTEPRRRVCFDESGQPIVIDK